MPDESLESKLNLGLVCVALEMFSVICKRTQVTYLYLVPWTAASHVAAIKPRPFGSTSDPQRGQPFCASHNRELSSVSFCTPPFKWVSL